MATRSLPGETGVAGKPLFQERRKRFLDHLGDAAAILPAAPEAVRSQDTRYRYRQDNDFYYLTGFPEPGAVAVFLPEGAPERFLLFVRERDPERETWDGRRAGVEGASAWGAEAAYPVRELDARLEALLEGVNVLYYGLGRDEGMNRRVLEIVTRLKATRQRRGTSPVEIRDPAAFLSEMRLTKSEPEIERLRRAGAITAEAHRRVMQVARPGMLEYEIEALLAYVFRSRGGSGEAYNSIVGAGENATILHYTENRDALEDGDLVLVDAGCEYDFYCADVTRTFPAGAAFGDDAGRIYEIVLAAQKAAIEAVAPGAAFDAPHRAALAILVEGLRAIGVLEGETGELVEREAYKPWYMHRTSHWLGMDVHDVGLYVQGGRPRALEPGMVLTIEPGLYFGAYAPETDPRWRGIGVRIEDDVLVTDRGREILTGDCPREIAEIEKLRRQALAAPSPLPFPSG